MKLEGRHLFTSESVTEGHPDKSADQISEAILDAILAQDPVGRVACETLVTTGLAMIAGEITTSCYVDFPKVVRETIRDIGYTRAKYGFDSDTCAVLSSIHEQSPDIAAGVDPGGAGDQGMMFGFACRETDDLMPLPIVLAHKLCRALSRARRAGDLDYLRPDGKSQVTVEYDGTRPIRVDAVVVSTQHSALVSAATLQDDIVERIVRPVIPPELFDRRTKIFVNTIDPETLRDRVVPRLFKLKNEGRIAPMKIAFECDCLPNCLKYNPAVRLATSREQEFPPLTVRGRQDR